MKKTLSLFLAFTYLYSSCIYKVNAIEINLSEQIKSSQHLLKLHMKEKEIPGLSVAVRYQGQLIWSEGFGFADIENNVISTPQTKMRIGSISKAFTSAALGLLIDQKKIDIDLPIQRYVPNFPEKKFSMNTRQLAGHLSGIRHYKGENYKTGPEFLNTHHYKDVIDGLRIFENDPLLFRPGDKFKYSSYGYNLLSAVIQGSAQQNFLSFMENQVFEPLNMVDTMADSIDTIILNRADTYSLINGKLIHAPFVDNSYKLAGGGFLSSVEDVAKFGDAIISGTFLTRETISLLFTPQTLNNGKQTEYGMGWFTYKINELENIHIVGHEGGGIGGSSMLFVMPDKHLVLALTCNLSNPESDIRNAAEDVLKLLVKSLPIEK